MCKLKYTVETFTKAANLEERQIEMIDEYKGSNIKIRFKCLKDGHIWEATPTNIKYNGSGCPKCAGKCGNDIIKEDEKYIWVDISTKTNQNVVMKTDRYIWELYSKEEGGRVSAVKGSTSKYIYANFHSKRGKDKLYKFHHFILPAHEHLDIDHHRHGDMNFIDNSIENIDYVTSSENNQNKSLQSNNKTGIAGVNWNKLRRKYIARITNPITKKRIHLGYFEDFFEACCARKSAEMKYYRNAYSQNN